MAAAIGKAFAKVGARTARSASKVKGVARSGVRTGKRLARDPMVQDMAIDAYMSNQSPAPDIYEQEPVYSPSPPIGTATSGVGIFNMLETVRWVVVCTVVILVVAYYFAFFGGLLSWIPFLNLDTAVNFKCYAGHGIAMILIDSLLTYIHKKMR